MRLSKEDRIYCATHHRRQVIPTLCVMMRNIFFSTRLQVFLGLSLTSLHCGYSALALAEKSANSYSWACIHGTEWSSQFIILAGIVGLCLDLTIGYFMYRVALRLWKKVRFGALIMLAFYGLFTIFISLNAFWIWASPMDCHFDFKRSGLRIKKYGTYAEIANSKESRINAIKTGCKRFNARPATESDYLAYIKEPEYINPYEALIFLNADNKLSREFFPPHTDAEYQNKRPVTYCILP